MRFMVMHATEPRWEAGERPDQETIGKVGRMIGAFVARGVFLGGDGLRASSLGVRLEFTADGPRITPGPFTGNHGVAAGFVTISVRTRDDAVKWASRLGAIFGEVEIDVRPLTETWDLGLAPKPPGLDTQRWMLLYKLPEGREPSADQRIALSRLRQELKRAGAFATSEAFRPSAQGGRVHFHGGGHAITDGPFAESKELIAGYVLLDLPSYDEALREGILYGELVRSPGVELRAVEDPEPA